MRGVCYRIGRLGFNLSVPATILLLWAAPAPSLPIAYMETGRLFTVFTSPYDGSMQIDGSVTFPTALPANLSLQNFATSFATNGGTY